MRKTNKLVIIITIVLCVLCISGFVTYGIIHSKLLEIKDEVNNLKVNVKVATADEAEPTIVLETVNPKSNLEMHPTANPIAMMMLCLMFSLAFLGNDISKKN